MAGLFTRIFSSPEPPPAPPPPVQVPRLTDAESADFHLARFNRAIAQFDPAKGPARLAELTRWRDYWASVQALGPRPE